MSKINQNKNRNDKLTEMIFQKEKLEGVSKSLFLLVLLTTCRPFTALADKRYNEVIGKLS